MLRLKTLNWLNTFNNNKSATLTLNGLSFDRSECVFVATGAEKHVYRIKAKDKEQEICFFIPHKDWRDDDYWVRKISLEKKCLDGIISLGVRAQHFEVQDLTITERGKEPQTIKVLVAETFASLCQRESLVIFNPKGEEQKVFGTVPDFPAMGQKLQDRAFLQKMIQQFVTEAALALAFMLPATIVGPQDDSEHFCFELPKSVDEAPVMRLMFWDVLKNFGGIEPFPFIPTLNDFKDRVTNNSKYDGSQRYPNDGINSIVNQIAYVIEQTMRCSGQFPNISYQELESFTKKLKQDIRGVMDDAFLEQALSNARVIGKKHLTEFLAQKNIAHIFEGASEESITHVISSVISIDDLELLKKFVELIPNRAKLKQETFNFILEQAENYNNPQIKQYLADVITEIKDAQEEQALNALNAKKAELKQEFLTRYQAKVDTDKSSWCGLYSFFVKSQLQRGGELSDLVAHASERTKMGFHNRTHQVMQEMGWLDDAGETTELIQGFIRNN